MPQGPLQFFHLHLFKIFGIRYCNHDVIRPWSQGSHNLFNNHQIGQLLTTGFHLISKGQQLSEVSTTLSWSFICNNSYCLLKVYNFTFFSFLARTYRIYQEYLRNDLPKIVRIHTLMDNGQSFAIFLLCISLSCSLRISRILLKFLNPILHNFWNFLKPKDHFRLGAPMIIVFAIQNR